MRFTELYISSYILERADAMTHLVQHKYMRDQGLIPCCDLNHYKTGKAPMSNTGVSVTGPQR